MKRLNSTFGRKAFRIIAAGIFNMILLCLLSGACAENWTCLVCGTENTDSTYCSSCECRHTLSSEEKTTYVFKTGDQIAFGRFDSSVYPVDPWHPDYLLWTVIDTDGRQALLLSNGCYENLPVNQISRDDSWRNSSIREWLNTVFKATFFHEAEQVAIIPAAVEDGGYQTAEANMIKVATSTDQFFALSYEEVLKYMPDEYQRMVNSVQLRNDQTDPFTDGEGHYGWWLRSVDKDGKWYVVDPVGRITSMIDELGWEGVAVRPAMWVDFKTLADSKDDVWYEVVPGN